MKVIVFIYSVVSQRRGHHSVYERVPSFLIKQKGSKYSHVFFSKMSNSKTIHAIETDQLFFHRIPKLNYISLKIMQSSASFQHPCSPLFPLKSTPSSPREKQTKKIVIRKNKWHDWLRNLHILLQSGLDLRKKVPVYFIRNFCVLQRTIYFCVRKSNWATITHNARVTCLFFVCLKEALSPQDSPSSCFFSLDPLQNNPLREGPGSKP